MNKKVLFISYFFPPVGGIGSLRISKFVKFLPQFDWQTYVLTVKKAFYPIVDEDLLKEIPPSVKVVKINYFEPAFWSRNRLWRSFLAYALYPLILFPDRQFLWFLPALISSYKIVKANHIKVIFTSSSPISNHLIGFCLKKITKVKWVADFRDEWTQSSYLKFLTPVHRYLAGILEKLILKNADQITTVSDGLTDSYQTMLNKNSEKFTTITNGFDGQDFLNLNKKLSKNKLVLAHAGSLYGSRKADIFLIAFKELNFKDVDLKFIGLKKRLSHKESLEELAKANVLLLILSPMDNSSVMTGKIFEYLALRRPILALAPEKSGATKLIKKLKVGEVVNPENKLEIKKTLLKMYQKWLKNDLTIPRVNIEQYERKKLTGNLAELFNKLIEKNSKIKLCLIGNIQSSQNQSLCNYFVKKDYEVHFITIKPGNTKGTKTYLLTDSSFTPWYFIKSLYKIKKIIQKIKPNIVHGQDLVFAGIWAYLSGFRPYVVTTWGSDVMNYDKFIKTEKYLIRKTLQKADLVTVSSEALQKQAEKIGLIKNKARMIHFGIDLDIFRKKLLKSTRQPMDKIIFCPRTIGPIYNIDILILAFATIAEKDKNIRLALLENIADENYLLEIEKLIIKYNLVDKVIFWTKVDNRRMVDYYNQAEVIVSISSSDGCSVSFLEAMACEKKIVATDLPYIQEWKNGKNLWQVPVRNVEATIIAISGALRYPLSKWQKLGEANRRMVAEKAEINNNFEKLNKFYQSLI